MSKIFISVGHGGTDPGCIAIDGSKEKDIALEVGLMLRDELKRHGVEVKMSREKDEQDKVADEVAECNTFKPDYGISIHCNASVQHTATGFEIWHSINPKSKGVQLAKNINGCVSVSDFDTRGLKSRANAQNKDYLAWIRMTVAPSVLCEIGFIDNNHNYAQLKTTAQRKEMAICIAKGTLETLGIKYIPVVPELNVLYTVQCGAFSKKENAEALMKELKSKGFDSFITTKTKG